MPADRRERPPLPLPLGSLGAPVYRAVVARRNRAFDAGKNVARAPIPVVSVGNLSVGGTGKTPMVMTIAGWLTDAGRKPGIAMRGYKKRAGERSDEEAEYADRLPGVPVIANPNRIAGLSALATDHARDCAILDDGFQHRFVARDLDIVLIDATRDPFADRCLPAGWLREPITSLARADAIVLTHAERAGREACDAMIAALREWGGAPALSAIAEHAWDGFEVGKSSEPIEWLDARPIVIAAGIGNPTALVRQADALGAQVREAIIKPDHHHWTAPDTQALIAAADKHGAHVLTTAKDWVKLRNAAPHEHHDRFVRPRLTMRLIAGGTLLREAVIRACSGRAE